MKIALIGDIGFFGKYSLENNPSLLDYFASAAKYFEKFDYVIGNLELPFLGSGQAIGAKSANLKSAPENIALLKLLNINVVTLANNHIYDFGPDGIESTVKALDENGILHFGLNGKDLLLDDAMLALHGYCCYSTNPYGLAQGVNKFNVSNVESKLRKYNSLGYLNLVSVHAGLEHINFPAYHDIQLARQLSKICPYIYHGHHPHVLQGIEKKGKSLLAYSLGNFCFDDVYTDKSPLPLVKQSENNKTSAVVEIDINNGQLESYNIVSLYQAECELEINTLDIQGKLSQYSGFLDEEADVYTQHRNNLFAKYVAQRKEMRDLNWYLKRLNYRSAIMILRSRFNQWQHKKNVLSHITVEYDK